MLGQSLAVEGWTAVDEAFTTAHATGEFFWEAELHRLRGELQLAAKLPRAIAREENFLQAIEVATSQRANLLVLRSSVSMGGLLRQMGRKRKRASA